MVDVQTCPSLEDIAAFLDGRVTAEERARLIRHLADCPTCLEVFAGAAQFLAAEEAAREAAAPGREAIPDAEREAMPDTPGEAGPAAAPFSAPLLPFRRSRRPRPAHEGLPADSRRWARRLGIGLAAAALATTIGVPGALIWISSRPTTSANLVEPLTHSDPKLAHALLTHLYPERRTRGSSPTLATISQEFMLGVYLLDFHVALQADDREASQDKARLISTLLAKALVPVPEQQQRFYSEAMNLDKTHTPPRSLLSRSLADEGALEEIYQGELPVGRWVEAAHVAAGAGNRDFFRRRANRKLLAGFLNLKDDVLEPKTRAVLKDLRQHVEKDDLANLKSIATKLKELIDSNERSRAQD